MLYSATAKIYSLLESRTAYFYTQGPYLSFITQLDIWKPKIWHQFLQVYNISSVVFNKGIFTLINTYFILIIIMMAQMLLDLHGVGIKWNITQPKFFL